MSILNFSLQQRWWSAALPKSPGKCSVIEGGFIAEHNKARQKRLFLFPSRFHECHVIAEKDADKGGTLEPWAGITVDRLKYVQYIYKDVQSAGCRESMCPCRCTSESVRDSAFFLFATPSVCTRFVWTGPLVAGCGTTQIRLQCEFVPSLKSEMNIILNVCTFELF